MFQDLLKPQDGIELPYDTMVEATEGYSGSDIRIVCKEAAMRPLRRLMSILDVNGGEHGEGILAGYKINKVNIHLFSFLTLDMVFFQLCLNWVQSRSMM
jgi:hypothetical protein